MTTSRGDAGASDGPEESAPTQEQPASHDPTGLDLARSVAAQLRGATEQRPRPAGSRRSRRRDPSQLSGAHPDDRDPTLLGTAVDKLVQDSGWSTDVNVHAVLGRWPQIVG